VIKMLVYAECFVLMLMAFRLFTQEVLFVNPFSILPPVSFSRVSGRSRHVTRNLHLAAVPLSSPELTVQLAQKIQPSVALVLPKGVRNMTARGSGFVLEWIDPTENSKGTNSTYLITAAHVAAPGYELGVIFYNGDHEQSTTTTAAVAARVVARNASLDLALIEIVEQPPTVLPPDPLVLATELPSTGTLAFALGWPASRLRGPAMTGGVVCGMADGLGLPSDLGVAENNNSQKLIQTQTAMGDSTLFVVTDAAMSGGMSGGPLVNTTGHVVGVNALIRPDLRALGNYAISTEEVMEFLQQISRQKKKKKTNNQNNNSAEKDAAALGENQFFSVWLFDDPMNKRQRVASILKEVAMLNESMANQVMMQAHTTGRGIVSNFTNMTQAESMCQALRNQDLLVEVMDEQQ
jgi:S1-C subfamily serine protease